MRTEVTHLVTGPKQTRRERRERDREARQVSTRLQAEDHAAKAEAKAEQAAERAITSQVPRLGPRGKRKLRQLWTYRARPHEASTKTLSLAYPFLAERGLGSRGVYIGADEFSGEAFFFDPWVLYQAGRITNPNIALFGIIGRGKSALAKSLVVRSIGFGRQAYVPGEPKGEWTPVAKAVGGAAIELGPGRSARINPLDEGTRPAAVTDDAEWAALARTHRLELLRALTETINGGAMTAFERSALSFALDEAVRGNRVPQIGHVVRALLDPDPGMRLPAGFDSTDQFKHDGRKVGHALQQMLSGELAGIFDGESSVSFDSTLPMLTIDLSAFGENSPSMPLLQTCAASWMESAVRAGSGQRFMIYDEAWRTMRDVGLLRRMQAQWKLSRAWGLANVLVMHRTSDLDAVGDEGSEARALAKGLLADCGTRIVYAQEADQLGKTATELGLKAKELEFLPSMGRGTGLWKIGQSSFIVRHELSPMEVPVFNTDARMGDRG